MGACNLGSYVLWHDVCGIFVLSAWLQVLVGNYLLCLHPGLIRRSTDLKQVKTQNFRFIFSHTQILSVFRVDKKGNTTIYF